MVVIAGDVAGSGTASTPRTRAFPHPADNLIDVDVESISGAAPDPRRRERPLGRYRYAGRCPAQLAGER
jgi:hypothetical protein